MELYLHSLTFSWLVALISQKCILLLTFLHNEIICVKYQNMTSNIYFRPELRRISNTEQKAMSQQEVPPS